MLSRWVDADANQYVSRYASLWGPEAPLGLYTLRLISGEDQWGWHSGGSISCKAFDLDLLGEQAPSLYWIGPRPGDIRPLDLAYLKKMRALEDLRDEAFSQDRRLFPPHLSWTNPPHELLVHAFLGGKCIIHVHEQTIRVLASQPEGEKIIREALGEDICILDFMQPGFRLAKACAAAIDAAPDARAMVWLQHGLLVWGETAREAYELLIDLVGHAEHYLDRHFQPKAPAPDMTASAAAAERFIRIAPMLRGLLAQPTTDSDRPKAGVILHPLVDAETLAFVDSERGRGLALATPLASDFPQDLGALPLWIQNPRYDNLEMLQQQIVGALKEYAAACAGSAAQQEGQRTPPFESPAPLPSILFFPGMGAVCAGSNVQMARQLGRVAAHDIATKVKADALSAYRGLPDPAVRHSIMLQRRSGMPSEAKTERPLERQVALVTGAAGAIGVAICEELLRNGCNVAVTDLPGESLDSVARELAAVYGPQVTGFPLDVADPGSVTRGFETAARIWGGVDLLIINAGLAHVSSLEAMSLDTFRKLARVNMEGTLLLLREATRYFRLQGTGGDVILISTKNVFAPGASFGAYSATKAASHQLARIASLELAEMGVRVNMVAPDAVFSHGQRRSGLWAEVGPGRMKARGLTQAGLEDYYRNRNLLKAKVTASHVARAVLFFATRQTPTTGATLPVDGGLPDATPR